MRSFGGEKRWKWRNFPSFNLRKFPIGLRNEKRTEENTDKNIAMRQIKKEWTAKRVLNSKGEKLTEIIRLE